MNNYAGEISLFKDKELWNFLHKTEVENADWPSVITFEIIDKILSHKEIIIERFIHHRRFLDTRVHEKLAQKVMPTPTWIGLPISDYWLLRQLLISEALLSVLLSEFFYFFIFYFVFWKI